MKIKHAHFMRLGYLCGLALLIATHTNLFAADIKETSNRLCAFSLNGNVVPGDFDRLSNLISKNQSAFDNLDERTSTVCLKSLGGSYSEGLKIAELIYSHGISTLIESGSECFSSCAIIFMAGVAPDRLVPMRKLSAGGVLGFHAPYLTMPDEKYSKEQLEDVVQSVRVAILKLVEFSSKQTKLEGGDFVKKSLIYRLLQKGPKDVFFVTTISEAARWNILIYDATENYRKLDSLEEIKNLCNNFHYSNMDEAVPPTTKLSVKVEQYVSKFHRETFRVLVQNDDNHANVCEIYPTTFKGSDKVKFFACSFDYWSSKSFGDCRNYKTTPAVLIGRFVPDFFGLSPTTALKKFAR
ncbi:COG3904 family protein [Bradyrhizobium sp.]